VTDRTYGTYAYHPPTAGTRRGEWHLSLEPATAVRLKRVFARARSSTRGSIVLADTIEVARDIEWALQRWPLVAADDVSAQRLRGQADAHVHRERTLASITAGAFERLALPVAPAREPRDYQLTAIDVLRTSKRLMLTDALGLGKTFTALLGLVHADALPALIVTPTHLPSRWVTELNESFPSLSFEVAKNTKPSATFEAGQRPDVLIVPYSRLAGWQHHLAGWPRTVIFDEVQDLRKGIGTQKGSAAKNISDEAEYVLGLTATPVYNYGDEVWELFNIIAPGYLGSRDEFLREWGGWSHGNHVGVADPAALGSYLREQGLMLGRTRADVGRELPATIKVPYEIEADPAAIEKVKGDARAMAQLILSTSSTRDERFRAAGNLDWKLREATGIAKAPFVAEFCRMILESEQKLVLFGWHRAVYDIWLEALKTYNPVLYTGSESPTQKDAAAERFVNGDSRILIMSLRSGAGVDGLQLATRVAVFGELDWSPQVHEQGIGRLRRDGMGDEPPIAYYLNAIEGSDPVLMETLQVKRNQAEPLISPDGRLLTNSTQDINRSRALAEYILGGSHTRKDSTT
jgi:hypothetical protein